MIVRHRWRDDGICSRCGAGKRVLGERTQYRAEGAQWWGDTIGDCRGDLTAPFRVVKQIPLHGRITTHTLVGYRGTLANCRTWLRDHKKLMGSLEVGDFYQIEKKEGSSWTQVSSSTGAKVQQPEKPSTPPEHKRPLVRRRDANTVSRVLVPSSG